LKVEKPTITLSISPELEKQVRERAEAAGLSVSAYIERLLREDEGWAERMDDEPLDESDPEFAEVQAAIDEGFQQLERGDHGVPAEDFFRELRAKRGLPH
jgi:hypothetical protein